MLEQAHLTTLLTTFAVHASSARFSSPNCDNVSPQGVTSMNVPLLRIVRLGTPLKSVNGFALRRHINQNASSPNVLVNVPPQSSPIDYTNYSGSRFQRERSTFLHGTRRSITRCCSDHSQRRIMDREKWECKSQRKGGWSTGRRLARTRQRMQLGRTTTCSSR